MAYSSCATRVFALETAPLGEEPVLVDVSESASLIVNVDNRNTRPANVSSQIDDDWSMAYNRLDTQANWKRFRLQLRLDSAYYFTSQSPQDVSLSLLDLKRRGREGEPYTVDDGDFFVQKFHEAGDDLGDRFVNWTYPAKFSLGYESEDVEVTAGDFYAQYGQGLVLSVRKQDELASDTTIRGARVLGKLRTGELRLKAGALYGTMNPLRIDDQSGRHLAVTDDALPAAGVVTEALMPRAIQNDFFPDPVPNYAPDQILGIELEGRSDVFGVGVHGTRLLRTCVDTGLGCRTLSTDVVRSASTIDMAGVFVDLPRLGDGAIYLEYAHQSLSDFTAATTTPRPGNAVYGRASWLFDPVSLSVEGRHYRSFFPLRANIDIGRAPEFASVQYSAPPTTEDRFVDTEFEEFNTCVTGGRAKADWGVAPGFGILGWVGHYYTWGETGAPGSCDTRDDNLNRVWDLAQGVDFRTEGSRSFGNVVLGTRFDSSDRPLLESNGSSTHVFYREEYVRHDVAFGLGRETSLQFQAWHRRRRQTLGGPLEPWLQGITTTALQLNRALNFAFGFEYDQNPALPDVYFNGQVRYDFDIGNVTLFGGQRQGGLRCVAGVCRVFPPFEGVRLDTTFRF